LSDGRGRPLALLLTAGNINDISVARALLQMVGPIRGLIADRGYDANHLRCFLADQRAKAVIPSTTSRRKPIPYDTVAYRDRNRIERMWCRLKDWRRLATRYDKLARNYLSGAYLAAIFSCWAN
jgi:transposase